MNRKITSIIIAIVVLVVLMVSGISHLRENSPLFNLFFSPSDLYSNLAEVEFNLSNEVESHALLFKTKYPGNHAIFIDVSKVVPIGEKYGGEFLINVGIRDENKKLIFNKKVSKPAYSFWKGKRPGGIALVTFDVPEDIPQNQLLRANISVLKKDSEFQKRLGPLALVIRKYSDE